MDASHSGEPDLFVYHFPRHGVLHTRICPYTRSLMSRLEEQNLVSRMRYTNQLGNLRYFYPGAHHTRYEYMMLQWHLLDRMADLKAADAGALGLRSRMAEMPALPGQAWPTGVDVLQTVVLLANVGHLPETVAAERAVLELVVTDSAIRQVWQDALKDAAGPWLQTLQTFDVYRVHFFLIWLWLVRELNRDGERGVIRYALAVLERCLGDEPDSLWTRLLALHRHIRRISYLTLDTLYTPAPFTLELPTILADFAQHYDAYVLGEGAFQAALTQLNVVMRDLVYQSPDALISMAETTRERLSRLRRVANQMTSLDGVLDCLFPHKTGSALGTVLHGSVPEADGSGWHRSRSVAFRLALADPESPPWRDTVQLEQTLVRQTGEEQTVVACDRDPEVGSLGIAFSMRVATQARDWPEGATRLVRALLKELLDPLRDSPSEVRRLYLYALRAFSAGRLRPVVVPRFGRDGPDSLVVASSGAEAAKTIAHWRKNPDLRLTPESELETEVLQSALRDLTRVPVVVNAGQTQWYHADELVPVAEWDGAILLGSASAALPWLMVVEAKMAGSKAARQQLEQRLPEIFSSEWWRTEIHEMPGGATAWLWPASATG